MSHGDWIYKFIHLYLLCLSALVDVGWKLGQAIYLATVTLPSAILRHSHLPSVLIAERIEFTQFAGR